jgi:D-glycero-alpha-D-manno-heptose 1-phosphate guanylyltransferase
MQNPGQINLSASPEARGQGAVVLAGGLGTRLRSAVADLPKCMAPVAGRPFLGYVIDKLRLQGVEHFVFSLGYLSGQVEDYLKEQYPTLDYTTVVEEEPLGTGGGILLALKELTAANVIVANGDTLFDVNISELTEVHECIGAACTLALKPMKNFDRYGVVTLSDDGIITGFEEKKWYEEGLINGGLYLLDRERILAAELPEKCSFEKDFLEPAAVRGELAGSVQEGYFIDIGIPEDYHRAQHELAAKSLDLSKIDKSWTLFLDRDGVINDERVGYYVLNTGEFKFSEGVLEAMPLLEKRFGKIVVVSNQRGVGKGMMSLDDLESVHTHMKEGIAEAGGRLDNIYFCTEKDDRCFFRKPNPGMALRARADFPEIDLGKTIMVGNKPGDMRFGRAAGVYTVFVTTTNPTQVFPHPDIDLIYPTLLHFARSLQS